MYLRASNVSLQFRLDGHPGESHDFATSRRLGGVLQTGGRHHYVRALDDVSIDLRHGDRLAVIGHNGSGKSTLLKVLAGIYPPQAGRVESDRPVSGMFNISLGFRSEATGYRNIMLKGLIAGKTRAEIEAAIPEIAAFTELGPYLDMPLRTYSSGMAMRLAFSVATAFSSDILLMDEWIGAGDAQFREKIVKRMTGFVESAHILVLASHSAQLLRRVANRAIWLEAGRIREEGPVDELVDRYEAEAKANARAARVRVPIRKEGITLNISPERLDGFADRDPGQVGEIYWDAHDSGLDSVEISVVGLNGREVKFMEAAVVGRATTKPWLKPGVEFRLKDPDTGDVLASRIVEGTISTTRRPLRKDEVTLSVDPSAMVPNERGMVGEVRWDAMTSGADAIEISVIGTNGREVSFFRGGPSGRIPTQAWLKPGVGFRLKDAQSGEVLASVTVGKIAT
jgi:ABC-type polysaccharide/polyol phosphate transport system ATPase subunit